MPWLRAPVPVAISIRAVTVAILLSLVVPALTVAEVPAADELLRGHSSTRGGGDGGGGEGDGGGGEGEGDGGGSASLQIVTDLTHASVAWLIIP